MRDRTLPLSHFEAFYERGADPWGFASSAYEDAKYGATLAALPRARYAKGFEVGCSIGVFTARLAERCDDLLAVEPVANVLEAARRRNATRPWVRFAPLFIPGGWPNECFDLVILSEVLDYLGGSDLQRVAECLRTSLAPQGDLVLVHWVGKKRSVADPSEASEVLLDAIGAFTRPLVRHRNADYRLDVVRRSDKALSDAGFE